MPEDRSGNPGCLFAFLSLFRKPKRRRYVLPHRMRSNSPSKAKPCQEVLPYRTRDNLLSAAEVSYYHVLCSLLKDRATVCSKVRLGDIFYVRKVEKPMSFINRITSKHVDFLLCEPKTMKPLLAIELDDSSHNGADRRERDEFVDEVFAAAGLPLVHVKAKRQYNPHEVGGQVLPLLSRRQSRRCE